MALLSGLGAAPTGYVPSPSAIVVYEANLRALGPKVGFDSLRKRLDSIRALGANVLWLMPIQPVGKVRSAGGLGSPYAVADFDKVNPEFGNADDLRNLIKAAHHLRMAVILDWVADHTAWDHPWIAGHPDWYLHTPKGDISIPPGTGWRDVAALNFGNLSMRRAMAESMKGWITRFGVDGFRCDAADRIPLDFWRSAITALRASTHKKLLMLAEGFRPEDYRAGFDLTYAWNFNSKLRQVFAGQPATEVGAAVADEAKAIPPGALRLRFLTNHDMSAFDGSNLEFYKTPEGERTAFAITALYGGTPLIYTGQEVGWEKRIPIFDESSIDWSANADVGRWIATVLELRLEHPAFAAGTRIDRSTNDVVIFCSSAGADHGLVLANVRDRSVTVSLPSNLQGRWLAGESGKPVTLGAWAILPPYGRLLLVRGTTH